MQLFFVLSGYLITSILRAEKCQDLQFYLKRFYWRRTLRIFPVYFGYLLLFTTFNLLARPSLFEIERNHFNTYWAWLFSYTFNYVQASTDYRGTYFFHHFWSLCIEEQFYLIWPLVVFLLSTEKFLKLIYLIIAITPIIRFLSFQHILEGTSSVTIAGIGSYAFSFCQIDAFAIGALISSGKAEWVKHNMSYPVIILTCVLSIGLINMAFLNQSGYGLTSSLGYPSLMTDNYQYIWGYSLVNLAGLALIQILSMEGALSRFFNNRALVQIGKISYGVYVFHFPILDLWGRIFRFQPFTWQGGVGFIGYFLTTLSVASLSYHLYEKRFLAMKDRLFRLPL